VTNPIWNILPEKILSFSFDQARITFDFNSVIEQDEGQLLNQTYRYEGKLLKKDILVASLEYSKNP